MIALLSWQGACILTGIGFNGYDTRLSPSERPKALWDRVENNDIWKIETAQSFKVLFDSWNCRANVSFLDRPRNARAGHRIRS